MARTTTKQQRPGNRASFDARAKLHLRIVATADGPVHVLTLRPGTDLRFSTNRAHGTWHILTDPAGSQAFARLLWGLSYQRVPRSVVLIDSSFLEPNPFDAAPSMPILLAATELGGPARDAVAGVVSAVAAQPWPDRTARLATHGLDLLADRRREARRDAVWPIPEAPRARSHDWSEVASVGPVRGVLVLRARVDVLRAKAIELFELGPHPRGNAVFIGRTPDSWSAAGEVQVFSNYRRRVGAARLALQEIAPDGDIERQLEGGSEDEALVWQRGTHIRHRQNVARRRALDRRGSVRLRNP